MNGKFISRTTEQVRGLNLLFVWGFEFAWKHKIPRSSKGLGRGSGKTLIGISVFLCGYWSV